MKTDLNIESNRYPTEQTDAVLGVFEKYLPSQVIQELYRETNKTYYSRILPPLSIMWGFIFQRLNGDHSLDAAWSHLSSDVIQKRFGLQKERKQPLSESTSAYSQARQRLPLSVAKNISILVQYYLQPSRRRRSLAWLASESF